MATTVVDYSFLCVPHKSARLDLKKQALSLNSSHFISCKSLSKLKQQSPFSPIQFRNRKPHQFHAIRVIKADAQSNFVKVLQAAWKVGKDGIEAGTNLVPDSVPRPVARISVTVATGALVLFVFKSILSTVFFVLAMMGLIYFTYIALNKDEGPKGGGGTTSTEDSLEEARRIMEKYK